jgi:outer membrane lipoprotein-sorting protein
MHIRSRLALLFLSLIFSSIVYSQSLDLDTVLEQIIDTYGGEENLRQLDSQIQEWDVVALMSNRHGTDVRAVQTPDRLRVDLTYPGKSETRIVNGENSYVIYDGAPAKIAVQPQRDAMRLQLMRLYSPLVLRSKLDSLSLVVEGDYYALTLLEHGVRVDYMVNTDNWRIEKAVGSLAINGTVFQFLTEYSKFTFRDGVLLHERENKFAGGVNTAVLQLRRLTLDAKLPDTGFMPSDDNTTEAKQDQTDII